MLGGISTRILDSSNHLKVNFESLNHHSQQYEPKIFINCAKITPSEESHGSHIAREPGIKKSGLSLFNCFSFLVFLFLTLQPRETFGNEFSCWTSHWKVFTVLLLQKGHLKDALPRLNLLLEVILRALYPQWEEDWWATNGLIAAITPAPWIVVTSKGS